MSKQLAEKVWALKNCAGCGLCVAACSKQVLQWNGGSHPTLETRIKTVGYSKSLLDSCSFCEKFCEEVCPRLGYLPPLNAKTTLSALALHALAPPPNGVIQNILAGGMSAGLLDGVVTLDLDPWNLKPISRVAESVKEIVTGLGPQYLWAPTLDALNEAIFERGMTNIAVVGTPCVAQAIRKLKNSDNPRLRPYQEAIRLTIAIFCTGIYRPAFIEEILVKGLGIPYHMLQRLEVSPDGESLQAVLWDGKLHTIPRMQAEEYMRAGCGSCEDYLGESADLAVGGVGAREKEATLIIRTVTGEVFLRNAIQMKLIATNENVDTSALRAAADEKSQRARAQAFKNLRLLSLDGLADPQKRSEAIHQFSLLYKMPTRSRPKETVRRSCTGC